MPNLKAKVAYDGTNYYGWQKTSAGPSIEEALQCVLEQILQHTISLQAASRTDLGVHAEGQVINFQTDKKQDLNRLRYACNCLLPKDIRILELEEVPDSFHPTLDSVGKRYVYSVCNSMVQLPQRRLYSWHIPQPLDLLLMQEASQYFIGELDFRAFCNFRKNRVYESYVRNVTEVKIISTGSDHLTFELIGDHFLYKMVRNIVGTLIYVGLHKIEASSIPGIRESGSRAQAGITAPAHGLCLKEVLY